MAYISRIGREVARARIARGLSQTELSELSGVSRHTINRLEIGAADGISLGTLLKLARTLKRPVSDIVQGVR